MGRRQWVCGGWARADRRWVSEEERRVCGGRKKRWRGSEDRDKERGMKERIKIKKRSVNIK